MLSKSEHGILANGVHTVFLSCAHLASDLHLHGMEVVLRIAISRRLDSFPRHVTFSSRLSHTRLEKHHLGVLFFSSQKGKKNSTSHRGWPKPFWWTAESARTNTPRTRNEPTPPALLTFFPSRISGHDPCRNSGPGNYFFLFALAFTSKGPLVRSAFTRWWWKRDIQELIRERRGNDQKRTCYAFSLHKTTTTKKTTTPHTKFVLFQLLLLTWVTATGEGGNSTLIKLLDYSIWDGINAEKKEVAFRHLRNTRHNRCTGPKKPYRTVFCVLFLLSSFALPD